MDRHQESFERGPALARVACALPATAYNLTRHLLAASPQDCVFVPIRAMQYLAVIDREEIIFIDSQYRRWVELAWRGFRPQAREALDSPVAYEAVFHTPEGPATQRRLQSEFNAALRQLAARQPAPRGGRVLNLRQQT